MGLHPYEDPKKDRSNRQTGRAFLFILFAVMIMMLLANEYAAGAWPRALPTIAAILAVLLVVAVYEFWRRKEASK